VLPKCQRRRTGRFDLGWYEFVSLFWLRLQDRPTHVFERAADIANALAQTVIRDMRIRPDGRNERVLSVQCIGLARQDVQQLRGLRTQINNLPGLILQLFCTTKIQKIAKLYCSSIKNAFPFWQSTLPTN